MDYEDDDYFVNSPEFDNEMIDDENILAELEKTGPLKNIIKNSSSAIFQALMGKGTKHWNKMEDPINDLYDAINKNKTYHSEAQIAFYLALNDIFSFINDQIDSRTLTNNLRIHTETIKKNRKRTRRMMSELVSMKKGMVGVFVSGIVGWKLQGSLNNIFRLLSLIKVDASTITNISGIKSIVDSMIKTGLITHNVDQDYKNLVENIVRDVQLKDARSYYNLIAKLIVRGSRYEAMLGYNDKSDTQYMLPSPPKGWMSSLGDSIGSGMNIISEKLIGQMQTDETLGIAKSLNTNLDELFQSIDNFSDLLQIVVVSMIMILALTYLILLYSDKHRLNKYKYKEDTSEYTTPQRRKTGPRLQRLRSNDNIKQLEYMFGKRRRNSKLRKRRSKRRL